MRGRLKSLNDFDINMRRTKLGQSCLITVSLLFSIVVQGQDANRAFPFDHYPAGRVYKAKPAAPRLVTRNQREFRTVIRKGAAQGPNFAGHYTVVEWGCGSNCVVYAVVDSITGSVYDSDLPLINNAYPCGLSYKLESTLFVVESSQQIESTCVPAYYTWNGLRFVPVHSMPP